jgi:hypothetical protein
MFLSLRIRTRCMRVLKESLMPLKQFKPPPQKKPQWMSPKEWQDHLEELKAFEKGNFRQSGGRLVDSRSQVFRRKSR